MSLLVVWASPNEDGLTATAKDRVLAGIEKIRAKAEIVHLNKCAIKRCLRKCERLFFALLEKPAYSMSQAVLTGLIVTELKFWSL